MAERPSAAQLGFAEATLTLDNTDRALAYDADEVIVTRRYYRSGDERILYQPPVCPPEGYQ